MTYFAYGSNMSTARLRKRAPSARLIGRATLRAHALRFHKRGRDGSAKCDAVATRDDGDAVHGVLFEIDEASDWEALDRAEGGYRRAIVEVDAAFPFTTKDTKVRATAYLALPASIDDELLPDAWYRDLVVAGAREHDLPEDYIARIEDHPTWPAERP